MSEIKTVPWLDDPAAVARAIPVFRDRFEYAQEQSRQAQRRWFALFERPRRVRFRPAAERLIQRRGRELHLAYDEESEEKRAYYYLLHRQSWFDAAPKLAAYEATIRTEEVSEK